MQGAPLLESIFTHQEGRAFTEVKACIRSVWLMKF